MAGLVTALGTTRVLGVDSGAVPDARTTVHGFVRQMRPDADASALSLAVRTEGLVLDPTYSGRAMAGLVEAVRSGRIGPGERTVLLHTGGLPGLFDHDPF